MNSGAAARKGAHLHFDCASGAAGDMTLGALIDAGVPIEVIRETLDRLGVGGDRLSARTTVKGGVRAVDVQVRVDDETSADHRPENPGANQPALGDDNQRALGDDNQHEHGPRDEDGHEHSHGHGHQHSHGHGHQHSHGHSHGHGHQHSHGHSHGHGHGHSHGHGHQHSHGHSHEPGAIHEHEHQHGHSDHTHGPHRHYRDIRTMILRAGLDQAVIERALDMFERLARAEAHLHGSTVDEVAFHEVGAIDAIVDIVGTAAALAWLAPAAVTATAVAVGHGTLRCAHGIMPVPAPATLEILREAGGVMTDGGLARELCTPTGAAILAAAVTRWAPMPQLVPVAIGYGAGDADLPDRANVMRATIGHPTSHAIAPAGSADWVWRLEANIDDMSPEMCEHAATAGFAAGALDVWWTPIVMKKGRPALLMAALVPDRARSAVTAALLRETTTIGVRFDRVSRQVLDREIIEVDTPYGCLPVKLALLDGQVVNAAPEYEPCRQVATARGVPLKQIFAAVMAAYGAAPPNNSTT